MFLILNKEKKQLKNLLFLVLLTYRPASMPHKIYRFANLIIKIEYY